VVNSFGRVVNAVNELSAVNGDKERLSVCLPLSTVVVGPGNRCVSGEHITFRAFENRKGWTPVVAPQMKGLNAPSIPARLINEFEFVLGFKLFADDCNLASFFDDVRTCEAVQSVLSHYDAG